MFSSYCSIGILNLSDWVLFFMWLVENEVIDDNKGELLESFLLLIIELIFNESEVVKIDLIVFE